MKKGKINKNTTKYTVILSETKQKIKLITIEEENVM